MDKVESSANWSEFTVGDALRLVLGFSKNNCSFIEQRMGLFIHVGGQIQLLKQIRLGTK